MPSSGDDRAGRQLREAMREYERERAGLMGASGGAGLPRIPRYDLLERIGEGAAAVVFRARDTGLGREVAVKILREPLGALDETRERFLRETRVTASLSHPNLVTVFDAGEIDGRPYLVMELVRGRPLSRVLHAGPMEPAAAARMVAGAARGVQAAHDRGIIHRDLKPANILVTEAGEAKVGDFGLAQVAGGEAGMTRTGTVLGTPLYMAPEQVSGRVREQGPRTDVYGLGAILFELLTGGPPHPGESISEIYGRILSEDPPSIRLRNPKVAPDLQTIAMKALERDPARRYGSAGELADDLERHIKGEPVLARPPGAAAMALRWMKRQRARALVAVALLAAVAVSAAAIRGSGLRRAGERDRDTALQLLERGRAALDQASRYLYDPDADYDELIRRVEKGQPLIEEAVRLAPQLATGHHLLGRAWEIRGRDDKAEASWRTALAIDPSFGPAHYELGRLLLARAYLASMGRLREPGERDLTDMERLAAEAAREIEAAAPEEGLSREAAGIMVAYAKRDYEKLRKESGSLIERHPGKEGVEEIHWLASLAPRPPEERMAALDSALAIRPKFALALFTRGNLKMLREDLAGAAADYSEALKIRPRFVQAWLNRGVIRMRLKETDGAIADCSEAIRLDPSMPMAWGNRGGARLATGDAAGGLADFDEALKLRPSYLTARVGRANALASLGRHAEAAADFRKALETAPPDWRERPQVERALKAAEGR